MAKRYSQPGGGVQVEPAHQLAPDFVFNGGSGALLFGKKQYLSTGRGSGDGFAASKYGLGFKGAQVANGGLDFGAVQPITGDTFTVLVLANPGNGDGVSTLYSQRNGSAPFNQIDLAVNADTSLGSVPGQISCVSLDQGTLNSGDESSATTYTDGNWHVYGATKVGFATINLWFDGASVALFGKANTQTTSNISSGMKTRIGNIGDYALSGFGAACNIPLILIFDGKALSASEIAWVSREMLAGRPYWAGSASSNVLKAAAGGGTTISATPGNAVADGITTGVNRIISASPGNAAADGVTASIVRSIGAFPGNAVADGTTSGVNRIITTTVGNAVADGITATISTSGTTTISCSTGNAVADGISAAVTRTIAANPGNAAADGTTAAVTRTIATATGNAAADGVQAALIQKITASPGDAVANGSIAALIRTIAASPGNAVADGVTAAILANAIIQATPGDAVANGVTATITNASPTIGRPDTDTSNTGWTASTGSDLYAMLDEVTPDALDYIVTTATGSICEMGLQTTAYPGTSAQKLSYRASSSTGNSVIVRLKNTGGATVRSETQVLTSTDTLYEITLTAPEIAAITSGALSVELESA